MIAVHNLVKFYGDRKVLHGLNFSVQAGKICGFLGPNGSGKSTTMDILAGLLGPSSGTVQICGVDVIESPTEAKNIIGYLPDNPPLYKDMYVKDFLDFVGKIRGLKSVQRSQRVGKMLGQCGIADSKNRIIGNLSKGYRQRVSLAAALIHDPKVLILDEPTEGLDPNQIVLIRSLIQELSSERTVILSSHILSEVQATCTDAIIINHGKIASVVNLEKAETASTAVLYKFAGRFDDAKQWFHKRNFVHAVSQPADVPNALCVHFSPNFGVEDGFQSDLAKVTNQIVKDDLPLIGIEEQKQGLESLFFQAVGSESSRSHLS